MGTIIKIENATKSFKNKAVFSDINIDIEEGKSYGFIGYNGCGKSVLFKAVCGFSLLNSGSIKYKGQVIGDEIDFIKDTGAIIETPDFLNDLSGFKNLKIIAEIQNIIDDEQIYEALKSVNLYNERNIKVGRYSLGMKQKLRIAQAVMENPSILILDEPMNGLDKESVELVRNLLSSHVKKGGTLLLASHNKDDIDMLCQYVYEFENGKVLPVKV